MHLLQDLTLQIFLIFTSPKRSGKTTTLLKLYEKHNTSFCGFLTPDDENGKRYLLNLGTGVRSEFETPTGSVAIGRFFFSEATFAEGNATIHEFVNSESMQREKILVVDEIGPLELREENGFRVGLNTLLSAQLEGTCVILVVRPELADQLEQLVRQNGNETVVVSDKEQLSALVEKRLGHNLVNSE